MQDVVSERGAVADLRRCRVGYLDIPHNGRDARIVGCDLPQGDFGAAMYAGWDAEIGQIIHGPSAADGARVDCAAIQLRGTVDHEACLDPMQLRRRSQRDERGGMQSPFE